MGGRKGDDGTHRGQRHVRLQRVVQQLVQLRCSLQKSAGMGGQRRAHACCAQRVSV